MPTCVLLLNDCFWLNHIFCAVNLRTLHGLLGNKVSSKLRFLFYSELFSAVSAM